MAIHKVIERANDIFGPDGWASSITYLCMDYEMEANGKWETAATAHVRVTLANGSWHEDIGSGKGQNKYR
eukprot:1398-Heterococcus_DN1.PRE.2